MKDKTAIALIKEVQLFEEYTETLFKAGMELRYFSYTMVILAEEYGIPKDGVGEFEDMVCSVDKKIRNPKRIVKHMKCEGMKYR